MEHESDLLTNHLIQWHLPLVAFLSLLLRRGLLAEETDCFPSLKYNFPYLTSFSVQCNSVKYILTLCILRILCVCMRACVCPSS